MMQYKLIKFFGIQRSGNHAVINWILGLSDDALFFNFVSPHKKMLDNVYGVSVPDGVKAYCTKNLDGVKTIHKKHVDEFKRNGGKLLCSYENYSLRDFDEPCIDKNIVDFFGEPCERLNIFLLRNPFNMMVSTERLLRRLQEQKKKTEEWYSNELDSRLKLWVEYAKKFESENFYNGFGIVFDKFVMDREYRDNIAQKMRLVNNDKNFDFVSNAGQGSSFEDKNISDSFKDSLLKRWEMGSGDSTKVFQNNPDAIKLALILFGRECVPNEFYDLT